jgi:hypothetical protein
MRVVKVLAALICFLPTYLMGASLVFNSAPLNQEHLHAKQMVKDAYESLGIKISLANLPYYRGAVSADYGVIDGLLLRLESHTLDYPNLIKINVPLLQSRTLVVINKALCGQCRPDKLTSLASVSGFKFADTHLNIDGKRNYLIELPGHQQLFKFFERGRVNAIITSEAFLTNALKNNDKYLYVEIGNESAFHYIHRDHGALKKQLESKLTELKKAFAQQQMLESKIKTTYPDYRSLDTYRVETADD